MLILFIQEIRENVACIGELRIKVHKKGRHLETRLQSLTCTKMSKRHEVRSAVDESKIALPLPPEHLLGFWNVTHTVLLTEASCEGAEIVN